MGCFYTTACCVVFLNSSLLCPKGLGHTVCKIPHTAFDSQLKFPELLCCSLHCLLARNLLNLTWCWARHFSISFYCLAASCLSHTLCSFQLQLLIKSFSTLLNQTLKLLLFRHFTKIAPCTPDLCKPRTRCHTREKTMPPASVFLLSKLTRFSGWIFFFFFSS